MFVSLLFWCLHFIFYRDLSLSVPLVKTSFWNCSRMFKLMIFDDFWKFSEKSGKMPKSDAFLGIWLYTKCVTFTHDSVPNNTFVNYFLQKMTHYLHSFWKIFVWKKNWGRDFRMQRLANKVAVVTGAASGLGASISVRGWVMQHESWLGLFSLRRSVWPHST